MVRIDMDRRINLDPNLLLLEKIYFWFKNLSDISPTAQNIGSFET